MRAWRVLIDGPADGAWNMAVDRAVLRACAEGASPPTLRLYSWDVPTVTLGRFQSAEGVDWALCRGLGVGAARRPTGGRGVLHDDEVTYSIVAGTADGVPRGVSASYRALCGALVGAYRRLGVDAALTSRPRGEHASSACYLHATHADLSLGAAKLSGSAQVWDRSAVLQHGSFVVSRDVTREARVFRLSAEAARALESQTVTLSDALSATPSKAAIVAAIVESVRETFETDLLPGALSDVELSEAKRSAACFRVPESTARI